MTDGFLHGLRLRAGIQGTLKGKRRDLAVAYIGQGALLRAEMKDAANARIVCDLFSGFCNPSAMRELRDAGAEIRNLRGLHAKVYLGDSQAVVCSANLSSNGFGEGEKEQEWGLEAGILVEGISEIERIATWYEKMFGQAQPADLDDGRLDEAWIKRPRSRDRDGARKTRSLLEDAIFNPSNFGGIGFVFTSTVSPIEERRAAVADAVASKPDLKHEADGWVENAFLGWSARDVKRWPSEFISYHVGDRGGFYIAGKRLAVRSEEKGYVLSNRDWSGIIGYNFQGATTSQLLEEDRDMALKILQRLGDGRVFRTADELAEWYYREFER